uniref:Flavin-dependent L-tryptophan oxidase RebO n=1 Tax=Lentzea aerocolonigenes TaxID=68170 RepID=REBO_LENAE|nr:RecName: Full=Flavin-dependent L-tryptophan oxidase RebO; AltName: Full=L-amino acid oxidase protein; Short=L-AAO; Flags: Precursor [Lentzea aerocolonigenes]AAN01208.1 putative L-tryptophan oxidase [Lentzea aerocolonigenes]BAC10674.1 putative L-amino acid oxidase protein [Lentzea aerocolonigenes]BAC15750.1 L-amino acid oxygenase RebO [Lentzea aerocolonigenes]CAC93714.1 putative L-tryptophan oxidase [Lentzea aerocolonigenes]
MSRGHKKITVLGAGVAGLVAAHELEELGHEVEVLEGSDRLGGRVHTHRFGEGGSVPFVELGAMRIPTKHRHTIDYIGKLGLTPKLKEFKTLFSDDGAYHTTSAGFVRVRDAAKVLVDEFRLLMSGRDLREETILFGAWLTAVGDAIAPADFRAALRTDFTADLLEVVDRIDLDPFLVGAARDQFDLHAFFAAHPEVRTSCTGKLNRFVDDILDETSPRLLRLEGGMDQLVDALVERIRGDIRTGHEVSAIDVREDHVAVTVHNGHGVNTLRSDHVLCTIPFSVLRNLRLTGLSTDKLEIIHDVKYWSATKVAFRCREPFWERDGINGGASFGGGRIRQTYYPPVEGDPTRGAVLLASYTMGDDADVLGGMPEAQRHEVVLDEVGRMHPELHEPGMVVEAVSRAWGEDRWSNGAGVTRWGKDVAACEEERDRAARPEGRLYFAGEHCSSTTAWIDGAVESALAAVRAIEAGDGR